MPTRRLRLVPMLLLVILLHAGIACAARPDIVVFLSDDHGYFDTSVYGATDVRTPNMQRLARDGLTFTRAFVASPSCAPSRAALLTGLMPARNGAEANHTYARDGIKALPAYLHALGYEVAAFGKVAHGRDAQRHGFDRHDPRHDAALVAQYLAQRDSARPLCLFVGTHQPHVPWPDNDGYDPARVNLPPSHVDTPETRAYRTQYYTDVTIADTELGEIYDLARKKLPKNTLFVYTSDHGAQWPLGKWNLYDEGIRTPLIAVWPGVLEPGGRSEAMVSWVDLLPTFIELAGGTPPKELDGRSFAPLLRGRTDGHREVVFATHSGDGRMNIYPIRCVRTDRFKYILNLRPDCYHTTHIDLGVNRDGLRFWRSWERAAESDRQAATIVRRYHQRPREEFYDVKADPYELKNLVDSPKHQAELDRLRGLLAAWMKEQGDQKEVFREPYPVSRPKPGSPADAAGKAPPQRPPGNAAGHPLLPKGKVIWRYTTTRPADGWEKPGFDDGDWSHGPGGFGKPNTRGSQVRTRWLTKDIWLRRKFELTQVPKRPALLIHHDEDAEVFLGGKLVGKFERFLTNYQVVGLDGAARDRLARGENLLAVHCRQTTGGQYIDVHVIDLADLPKHLQ